MGIGVLALGVGVFLLYIKFMYKPHYAVSVPSINVQATPARLERGRELVLTLCAECHKDPTTRQLSGRKLGDLPEMFGTAYSRNITQDKEFGIGAWSDGDIVWLLRTGIHPKTGDFVPPWMVKLTGMADEDMFSIVSFLRSDDPMVQAVPVANKMSEASLFAKVLTFLGAFKPYDYPTAPIAKPDSANTAAYGEYMANGVFACYECHSADFASNDRMIPKNSTGFYGGGNRMPDYEKLMIPVRNLTPSKAHGIGSWTEDQFVSTLKTGFRSDGSLLRYPMVRLTNVPEWELRAMHRYLSSIPALENAVPAADASPIPSGASKGERLYIEKGCVHCHGTSGVAYADLRAGPKKFGTDSSLAAFIAHPEHVYPETVMPVWESKLTADEMKEIVQHVKHLSAHNP